MISLFLNFFPPHCSLFMRLPEMVIFAAIRKKGNFRKMAPVSSKQKIFQKRKYLKKED